MDQSVMHHHNIESFKDLPVQDRVRKPTDVCCTIIGVLFGLALFIAACICLNTGNLKRENYPSDSSGNICMLDTNGKYQFLYFNDINNPNTDRQCLRTCPQVGFKPDCFTNCIIGYYPNEPVTNSLGSFCLPTDQSARLTIFYNSNIYRHWNAVKAIDYLLIGVAISLGLACLWMLLVQFLSWATTFLAIILATILLLITGIILFIGASKALNDAAAWAYILGSICIVLLIVLTLYLYFHGKQVTACSQFIRHATIFIRENCETVLYIPLFILFTFLFAILIVFQYLSFASISTPIFSKDYIYYQGSKPVFPMMLLVLETIWGLSFIRDSFNYLISGLAIEWYYQRAVVCCGTAKNYFTLNFGSVVGGSLLNAFFFLPTLFISLLCPKTKCCLCNLFDLARTDVYGYIYLTGNSYCPSSRQAQYLCNRSCMCRENESTVAIYALSARLVIALSTILIIYAISSAGLILKVPPMLLVGIFFVALYISCYFVDIHVHASEALMLCFLCENDVDTPYHNMNVCRESLKKAIADMDIKGDI